MVNLYRELKNKQQKEFNDFSEANMFYAYNDKQFEEGMKKLGLELNQTDLLYSTGSGGCYLKTKSEELQAILNKQEQELRQAIEADKTGEGFIKQMFRYELNNYEYCYTYELDDTLDALGLTIEEVNSNPALLNGLNLALVDMRSEDY